MAWTRPRCATSSTAIARLLVLTGAGCSTDSGIPDYRNAEGGWKRAQPVMFQAFMADLATRRRYWARSLIGWRHFRRAAPNDTHHALAHLEARGRVELLVTQNVDRLHQAAGSEGVVDLHGRLDQVRCMTCGMHTPREELQDELIRRNPAWSDFDAREAPDGDADLNRADFSSFDIPPCDYCGGILKPDVVFFGESVPRDRVEAAMQAVQRCRRHARRRVFPDGVLRLPLRPGRGRCGQAHRRHQSRPHPRRRSADAESHPALLDRAVFSQALLRGVTCARRQSRRAA